MTEESGRALGHYATATLYLENGREKLYCPRIENGSRICICESLLEFMQKMNLVSIHNFSRVREIHAYWYSCSKEGLKHKF